MYFALTNKSSQVKQQNYTDHEIKSLNMCIEKYNYVNSCLVEIPLEVMFMDNQQVKQNH